MQIACRNEIPQLQKMAMTVLAYRRGILSWYDCHISTAKVEGINNKIKVMKRNAYGFRDERYFKLRLYALHDCRITRNVGRTFYLYFCHVIQSLIYFFCNTKISKISDMAKSRATFCCSGAYKKTFNYSVAEIRVL